MGQLVDGEWRDDWYDTKSTKGHFKRWDSAFRNWVTADGAPGPTGIGGFKAEAGRYHLYVSYACPWAHRTLIFRALKGLEGIVDLSAVHWLMAENGWTFEPGDGVVADPILSARFMHQIYTAAAPDYSGRVSVPVLWDKKTATIVSNESSEIIEMFNSAFDGVGARPGDYFPAQLREEIDAINQRVYDTLNNGVYKAGFATTQDAYLAAINPLFDTLDWLEERLTRQRFLVGDQPTAADWRAFPTLCRFDAIYHAHFKCSLRRLVDYPNLWAYTRDLYQHPGISDTVNMEHARRHYFESHRRINPNGIVPVLPATIDFAAPHGRAQLHSKVA
ncbi:MAG: glutathione S-transferase family protein [Hyphomicrobiaceae bacterium]